MKQDLGQGLKDGLGPQNDNADIPKVLQGFVWSNTLFQNYDQNSREMTSSIMFVTSSH